MMYLLDTIICLTVMYYYPTSASSSLCNYKDQYIHTYEHKY